MAAGGICRSLPSVTLTADDVHDDATLDRSLRGCDAAVNLVGILHGKAGKPYGSISPART